MPWLAAVADGGRSQALRLSWLVGFLFFLGTIWWVGYVTVPGLLLLVAVLALYFAAWGLLAHRLIARGSPLALLLGLPAAWCLLEYARTILLSGFGWNLLSHAQWRWTRLIQISDVTGAAGVSFLVVLVNAAVFLRLRGDRRRSTVLLPLLAAGAALAYGTFGTPPVPAGPGFRVAVLQGNVPQTEKWDEAFQEAIWKRYEELTRSAAAKEPELIVWPETSVPEFLDEPRTLSRLALLAKSAGTPMLVGAPLGGTTAGPLLNTAVLFGPDGVVRERYDKLHLVPFGEYVPLGPVLGWLRQIVAIGEFSPGKRFTVFPAQPEAGITTPPFSALICFEDLFPGLCRKFVQEGARWLVVITNDAWFRFSEGSLQHMQASVFRAVENRVWVARAANTGWSGFIDPFGRTLGKPHSILRFKPGYAIAELYPAPAQSLYTRYGDWFQLLCLLLLGWSFLTIRKTV